MKIPIQQHYTTYCNIIIPITSPPQEGKKTYHTGSDSANGGRIGVKLVIENKYQGKADDTNV